MVLGNKIPSLIFGGYIFPSSSYRSSLPFLHEVLKLNNLYSADITKDKSLQNGIVTKIYFGILLLFRYKWTKLVNFVLLNSFPLPFFAKLLSIDFIGFWRFSAIFWNFIKLHISIIFRDIIFRIPHILYKLSNFHKVTKFTQRLLKLWVKASK